MTTETIAIKTIVDNHLREFAKRWGVRPNGILMHHSLFERYWKQAVAGRSIHDVTRDSGLLHDGIPILRTSDLDYNVIRFVI